MKYEVWYETDTGEHYEGTYNTREETEDAVLWVKDTYGEDIPVSIIDIKD